MVRRTTLIALTLFTLLSSPLRAQDATPKQDTLGRSYYVYAPPRVDPKKTYWLVVGVHGHGGDGKSAAGMADWVKRGDCIVLGPSFPSDGYQLLDKQADEQLILLFDALKKQYKLHDTLFLYGFSGGAQFAHRFMMKHPKLVAGCCAHSGGSWSTGAQWMSINPEASNIPLVISCGMNDTDKMHPSVELGRYAWAQAFEKQLAEANFLFEAKYWPNTAHARAPGVSTMNDECYRLATQTIPTFEASVAAIRENVSAGKTAQAKAAIARVRKTLAKPGGALEKKWVERAAKVLEGLEGEAH